MHDFFAGLLAHGAAKELIVAFSSMFPIWEVKGAIILGQELGLGAWTSYFLSEIGSCFSAILILLFLKPIMNWMYKTKLLKGFAEWLEKRADKKGAQVRKYQTLGLFMFVAIPLPTTGVWTGSLIGTVLNMPLKRTIPTVIIGNLIAGLAVMLIYGVLTF